MISFNRLMESFFGLVFVITEHCLLLKFVLEKRLRERIFWKRRENFIFNGLSLCRWFNSMCTQWRCFASPVLFWLFESKFYMYANTGVYNHPLFRSFKNTQDNEPSSNTDEVIKITVASNFITEAARRPAVLIIYLWWQESFFVHVVTNVRNAQTTVASSFRLHFRCVWFFGPMATAIQL